MAAPMTDAERRAALRAMQSVEAAYSHSYPPDVLAGGPMMAAAPAKAKRKGKGSDDATPSPDAPPLLTDELGPDPEPVTEPAPDDAPPPDPEPAPPEA